MHVFIEDESGAARIVSKSDTLTFPGDIIHATGKIVFCPLGNAHINLDKPLSLIERRQPPRPSRIAFDKLNVHLHNNRLIETEGLVTDVFEDEIDKNIVFLMVKNGEVRYPVAIERSDDFLPTEFLGARIKISGIFLRRVIGYRTYSGPLIMTSTTPTVLTPPKTDPFDAPPVRHFPILTPQEVTELPRSSETGYVLATWDGNRFILRTPGGKTLLCTILEGMPLPDNDSFIKVVGEPETDLFRINLTRAVTRRIHDHPPRPPDTPEQVAIDTLVTRNNLPTGRAIRLYAGRTIRYRGIVQSSPEQNQTSTRMLLRTGKAITTIEAGTSGIDFTTIPEGSEVEVCGVCALEGDNWTPERILPRLHPFMLVLRSADDLVIIRNPPWWTTGRLFTAIGILLTVVLTVILWNRHLNKLVNRRGQELAREKLKKETARLKTGERTRLAVELHDSLSQNLEGVACQIAATRTIMRRRAETAADCLDTAERMLDSCRLELRRCLFDLRGSALEERNLAAAIETTLKPLCDSVGLSVRFDIRRSQLDDSTAHATLCIIRELVSNAIRHGQAKHIRVAGEYHAGTLNFSVTDDGSGFDPAAAPGPTQGHFGLEGIRERVDRFDGSVDIESAPGKGTRVIVSINLTKTDENLDS